MFALARLAVVKPETVSAPLLFDRPEPRRELNDEPLMMRLVVDAVAKVE